jgi:galactokinase
MAGFAGSFVDAYGREPKVRVNAPGRANLIGEHTDYSLLPVLPMAIDRAVTVECAPAAAPVVTARSRNMGGVIEVSRVDPRVHDGWGRYVAGALRELASVAPGKGADILIDSDLPPAGGLSSSSALTVAIIAALNAAWSGGLDREAVVAMAIRAERNVGVESGGMDQAIIAFGEAGSALRIAFDPPARSPVPLPQELAIVVASSGDEAPKGGAARDAYNERVVGCRLAATMICDQVGLDPRMPPVLRDISDVEVADILADALPEKVSPQEVAGTVGLDLEVLVQLTATRWPPRERVPVRRYARHVLSEALRVDEAIAELGRGDLSAFGRVLNASHESLRSDYRCSTPALDSLCKVMRRAGAFGARLTGAGFGGFALAACPPERVDDVMAAALQATGGPAFRVIPSAGYRVL